MDEDESLPEPEKPRYLLPPGCTDLIDVLRLRELEARRAQAQGWTAYPPLTDSLPEPPPSVALADPVTVGDLAYALQIEGSAVIHALLSLNIFAATTTELAFETASKVCASFGVAAIRPG